MKIHSVKYYDKNREWGYDTIHFSDLTLLVGVSGAGKTQILRSLVNLKNIVMRPFGGIVGVSWEVSFSNDGFEYLWVGNYEPVNSKFRAKLNEETLYLHKNEIVKRSEGEIFFEGKKMPKLSQDYSLIGIFKEEEKIKKAYEGFEKIRLRDDPEAESENHSYGFSDMKGLKTLEDVKGSDSDTLTKLYYLSINQKETFDVIKEKFIEIFPQVIDVGIEREFVDYDYTVEFSYDQIEIYIKEKGVKRWIHQDRISSGMLRTFLHISEMYLLKNGSVVLIDEFENSLGTNCINALAEDLMFENNNTQFIITSHHPYIINQIPYEYWKIVTRENGKIVTYDAEEFNLGESHHERFMNLINLPKYKKGIVHA